MTSLSAIGANLFLLVAAWGYGCSLEPWLPKSFSFLDRLAFTLLGGLGLTGTLLFVVGQFWFSKAAILLILLPGVIVGLKAMPSVIKGISAKRILDRRSALPAAIVLIVLGATVIGGLAEPVGDIRMDAIAYHFLGPDVWIRHGAIQPVIDEAYTAFPAIVEVQYAAVLAFGGVRALSFFAVISLISILLTSASLARRCDLDPPAAWWTLALVSTMPALYRGAYGGFVDAIYSAFVLAIVRVAWDAEDSRHYLLSGIFCGFALGTKYTGLIAAPLAIFCTLHVAKDGKVGVRRLALCVLAAALIAAPWYLRNWLELGSPIYPPPPLLSSVFHTPHLPAAAVESFHAAIWKAGAGMGRSIASFLALPFHLAFHPANFLNGAGGIGIVPLALAPVGIPLLRAEFAKRLALFAILQTIVWFITEQDLRFLTHVCIIATIFAVMGWNYLRRDPLHIRALAGAVVAVSVGYGLYMICAARADDVHAALSRSYAERRQKTEIPFLESISYLNEDPSATKILVLPPFLATYYLQKDYVKPLGRWGERTFPQGATWEQILTDPKIGITHVLDASSDDAPFKVGPETDQLRLVYESAGQRVYAVRRR